MLSTHSLPGGDPALRGAASPLSGAFWRESLSQVRDLRSLSAAALMVGLYLVLNQLSIPLTPQLLLSVRFVALALCGMLAGPVMGAMAGFVCDILGYFLFPFGGGFFPGYTLSTVLAGVIYGVALFRRRPTFWRCLAVKGTINLVINLGFGTLWALILNGRGSLAQLPLRALKNALLWPVEALLLMLVAMAAAQVYRRVGRSS